MKFFKYLLIAIVVIAIDQLTKMLVYNNMQFGPGGEIPLIGEWLKLHYTLNPGMAFGMEFGGNYGKLGLSVFRLLAIFGIGYYVYYLQKKGVHQGLLLCGAMIWGGAIGNVIDSTFYGVWFPELAAPFNGDAAPPMYPWFHGQVIDMIYVDIWEGYLPESIPVLGGQYYALWPIFNIADASIFVGVMFLLIYQRTFFPENQENTVPNKEVERVEQPENQEKEIENNTSEPENLPKTEEQN